MGSCRSTGRMRGDLDQRCSAASSSLSRAGLVQLLRHCHCCCCAASSAVPRSCLTMTSTRLLAPMFLSCHRLSPSAKPVKPCTCWRSSIDEHRRCVISWGVHRRGCTYSARLFLEDQVAAPPLLRVCTGTMSTQVCFAGRPTKLRRKPVTQRNSSDGSPISALAMHPDTCMFILPHDVLLQILGCLQVRCCELPCGSSAG